MARTGTVSRAPKFTDIDKNVLRGICRQPWGNDREISEDANVRLSTVTASKYRMKKNKIFSRAYLPAYHRLGYYLVSFSQIRLQPMAGIDFKTLVKNKSDKTAVPFIIHDSLNALIIAVHPTYSDFKIFERQFELPWQHELQIPEGANCIVNFDFTNTINKMFFPKDFENSRPSKIDTIPFRFVGKVHRKAFNGLVQNPEKLPNDLVRPLGTTRQTIVKIRKNLRTSHILDRVVLVDLEKIGISLLSFIKINTGIFSEKDIFIINKALKPFFYWNFEKAHYLLVGNIDYSELLSGLRSISENKITVNIDVQLFDIRAYKIFYGFDNQPIASVD